MEPCEDGSTRDDRAAYWDALHAVHETGGALEYESHDSHAEGSHDEPDAPETITVIANYVPASDVTQHARIDLDVRAMSARAGAGAFAAGTRGLGSLGTGLGMRRGTGA